MTTPPPDGFALIKPGQTYFGKQGITYGKGASAARDYAATVCGSDTKPIRCFDKRLPGPSE